MSKSITDNFNDLATATQQYIEATVAYHKLDLFKKAMLLAVTSVHKLLIGFVALLSLIFLSFALAIFLGEVMGNTYLGYLVVGALYFLLCLVSIFFLKPVVEKSILRKASSKMLNTKEEQEK